MDKAKIFLFGKAIEVIEVHINKDRKQWNYFKFYK